MHQYLSHMHHPCGSFTYYYSELDVWLVDHQKCAIPHIYIWSSYTFNLKNHPIWKIFEFRVRNEPFAVQIKIALNWFVLGLKSYFFTPKPNEQTTCFVVVCCQSPKQKKNQPQKKHKCKTTKTKKKAMRKKIKSTSFWQRDKHI